MNEIETHFIDLDSDRNIIKVLSGYHYLAKDDIVVLHKQLYQVFGTKLDCDRNILIILLYNRT